MNWIKASGVLVYEPNRFDGKRVETLKRQGKHVSGDNGFKKKFKERTLIIEMERDDLALFYGWMLRRQYGEYLRLQRPMWGNHVTVVRGDEKPTNMKAWKAHAGQRVEFEYSPALRNHWRFWSLPVRGNDLLAIRKELGLTPQHDFHITVGRQDDWMPIMKRGVCYA